MTSIAETLYERAKQHPDKPAVLFENSATSYAELWSKAVRLAHLFKKRGVPEGGRVICQSKFDPFFIAGIYAAHLCGAAVIPIDKRAGSEAIADLYARFDACLVLSDNGEMPEHSLRYDELEGLLPDDESMEGLAFPDPDSVAEIVFTTGTTGMPKGVQVTQRGVKERALVDVQGAGYTSDTAFITFVPLNHVAPMIILSACLCCGGTVFFLDGIIKIRRVFEYMDSVDRRFAMCVPPSGVTLIQQLVRDKLAAYADRVDVIHSSSAPMTRDQQKYLKAMLPHTRLVFSYASSEAGFVSMHHYDRDDGASGCCGRPCSSVDVQVLDEALRPLPRGQTGLLAIKSDMLMLGYYKLPALNGKVFLNGYFLSSDMGYIDEEGFLYVIGRADDIINVGGLKVFPSEIENAALRIPGIEECICFGVPDPYTGMAAKLLIKVNDGFRGSVAQVKEELSRTMDRYKVPGNIEIVTEIQKTANGKPNRSYYQSAR